MVVIVRSSGASAQVSLERTTPKMKLIAYYNMPTGWRCCGDRVGADCRRRSTTRRGSRGRRTVCRESDLTGAKRQRRRRTNGGVTAATSEAQSFRSQMEKLVKSTLQPRRFFPGEGKTYQVGRMTMTFKTTAKQDWNAYTVCEAIEPPESGAGLHRHATYDETFVICEGNYEFKLDQELLKLGPGDVVFVPRGTPHGFVSKGPEIGRQLIISSPGGIFDAMIAEVTGLDTGSPTRAGAEEAKAIAAKYGLEFLS